MKDGEDQKPRRRKARGFFALDQDQFKRAAKLGLEPAAAYLALMAGTDESNALSAWGMHAVSTYTGLTRHEARKAITALRKAELVKELEAAKTRARTKPRYRLPSFEQRQALSSKEQGALDAIRAGEEPKPNEAYRAQRKGWIEKIEGRWQEIPPLPDVAFLPNSFVRTKTGSSPLARILNAGELDALTLAIGLYGKQNLMESRGVPVELVRAYYSGYAVPILGHPFRLIRLTPGRLWESSNFDRAGCPDCFGLENEAFWAALKVLEHSHVVEWAVYTANGKPKSKYETGRPVRPVGVVRNGQVQPRAPESKPGLLAHMIDCDQNEGNRNAAEIIARWRSSSYLAAIEHGSVPHVEGVGILRMTHWADTENARAWQRQIHDESREAFFFYESVARSIGFQVPDIEEKLSGETTKA